MAYLLIIFCETNVLISRELDIYLSSNVHVYFMFLPINTKMFAED